MKFTFLCLAIALISGGSEKIHFDKKWSIAIPEPSDICPNPLNDNFFIVSDRGFLFETDAKFKPFRRTRSKGMDYEGVWADSQFVYAVEERSRRVNVLDIHNLETVWSFIIPYSGGRNAGYEGITYNPVRKSLILVTEKSPIWIFELDADGKVKSEWRLKEKLFPAPATVQLETPENPSFADTWKNFWAYSGPSDVSAIGFYGGKILVFSDEDSELLQLNPATYAMERRWHLGGLNPEGFCISASCDLLVMSDNVQKVFRFPQFFNQTNWDFLFVFWFYVFGFLCLMGR